jgi:hypothetical protein
VLKFPATNPMRFFFLPSTSIFTFIYVSVSKAESHGMALYNNNNNDSKVDCEMDDVKQPDGSGLKLDAHGVPLVPQPSDHKGDPLVCPPLSSCTRCVALSSDLELEAVI